MKKILFLFLSLIFLFACGQNQENKVVEKNIAKQSKKELKGSKVFSDKDSSNVLQKVIEAFINDSVFYNSSISFYFTDIDSEKNIISYNPDLSLVPASSLKLLTTATAFEILGKNKRFVTKIEYDGEIDTETQTLNGNIYIKGGGDPALGSKVYKNTYYEPDFLIQWVEAIKNVGIKKINGNIIADAQIFDTEIVPTSWTWEDIAAYYGTAASGLSIFENKFKLSFDPSIKCEYLVDSNKMDPFIPELKIVNKIRLVNEGFYLDILGQYYSNHRVIHGVAGKKNEELEIEASIPDPPYIVAFYLMQKLKENEVEVNGEATSIRRLLLKNENTNSEKRQFICETKSPRLSSLIYRTNMNSNNLYAEHFVKHIALKKTKYDGIDFGSDVEIKFWKSKGIDVRGLKIFDGCGISRKNKVTVRQLADICVFMKKNSSSFNDFYRSLPESGNSGTLKSFCKNTSAHGKIKAKSGSMSGVKSYA
ncbi:MAG: D-alanyl-D-alanine carboxypeptidase/D-alanyl-D-alanine-endopeptidase, partial [Bacteroidota bacterium]|nr:D-alanyl-D-alanine carboxypeptidase/D-alanyl-D-alanine-endopeptidase [Bacteroidota bacterium]